MKKFWILALLALIAAGLSVFGIIVFALTNLMRSLPALVTTTIYVSLAVIVAGMCAAFIYAWQPGRGRSYVTALVVTLAAGGAPLAVDFTQAMIDDASERAERRAFETKFLSQLETYKTDIAARIAAKSLLSPREAQNFVEFVQGSDLRHRSLPDHAAEAFALLLQALDAKILDPNARVKGPRAVDVSEEPLFVAYYKFYLQSAWV